MVDLFGNQSRWDQYKEIYDSATEILVPSKRGSTDRRSYDVRASLEKAKKLRRRLDSLVEELAKDKPSAVDRPSADKPSATRALGDLLAVLGSRISRFETLAQKHNGKMPKPDATWRLQKELGEPHAANFLEWWNECNSVDPWVDEILCPGINHSMNSLRALLDTSKKQIENHGFATEPDSSRFSTRVRESEVATLHEKAQERLACFAKLQGEAIGH